MSLEHDLSMIGDSRSRGILLTGAAGFIGSRIARRLLIDGFPVHGLVRTTDPNRPSRLRSVMTRRGGVPLRLIACDLHDHAALNKLIAQTRPAVCIHAAWDVTQETYRHSPANDLWVESSLILFRTLIEHECEWIGVCGTCIEPLPDERASCRYAGCKARLREQALELLANSKSACRLCWWRLFQPYGPGEAPGRLIPSMIDALSHGRTFVVREPNQALDFTYVDDIAGAVSASMAHRVSGTFDVGTGQTIQVADAAKLIGTLFNAPHLLSIAPGDESSRIPQIESARCNPQPLLSAAEWRSEIDFNTGVSRLVHLALGRRLASA